MLEGPLQGQSLFQLINFRLFSIDDNGAVTVSGDLLNGHFGEHRMTVVAMDHGDPPLETRTTLIIYIENVISGSSSSSVSFFSFALEFNKLNSLIYFYLGLFIFNWNLVNFI